MGKTTMLAALRGMGISREEMTPHEFRSMARTLLDEEPRERIELIEHQLGHIVRDANGRADNRTAHLAERKRMMNWWACIWTTSGMKPGLLWSKSGTDWELPQ